MDEERVMELVGKDPHHVEYYKQLCITHLAQMPDFQRFLVTEVTENSISKTSPVASESIVSHKLVKPHCTYLQLLPTLSKSR